MNALFLISEALTDSGGISKKIFAQVNALEYHGIKVALSYLTANDKGEFTGRYINEQIIDKYSSIPIISKFQWRWNYKNLYQYINEKEIKLIYIRYTHFANPFFNSFLKKLKEKDIIILMEIPSYPYDQEYRNIRSVSKLLLLVEKYCRRKFKDYVTRIITLSPDTTIFGIPTIVISNGVDPVSINIVKKCRRDNEIHLIAVASMAFWHGYDRVIEGLRNYYRNGNSSNKKVFLHLVGNNYSNESLRYKNLVTEYNLNNYVKFYERIFGKDLDTLFNQADIAVGCLGCHRKSMEYSKSLKNREYCARGIPFFYSEIDEDFEGKDFVLKVTADDEPVNIEQVINFISNNKFDAVKIRNYAFENLTWEKQFEKVLRSVIPDFKIPLISKLEYEPL